LEEKTTKQFGRAGRIPFVRGCVRLVGQLGTGLRALARSADLAEGEIKTDGSVLSPHPDAAEEGAKIPPPVVEEQRPEPKQDGHMMALVMVVALLLAVGMFVLLPNWLTGLLLQSFGLVRAPGFAGSFSYNLTEGLMRIIILILYMWLASRSKDIARTWQYHGAEHKTIACYEAAQPLTVSNVRLFSRFHPRCGTSFLFLVVLLSSLIFSFFGWYTPLINALIRIALIPLVAGTAYEIQRLAGRHSHSLPSRIISAPGLLLQRLTTKEPDDEMLEIAIVAMNAVLPQVEQDDYR
jgi:uncharacterized protein YqhQ